MGALATEAALVSVPPYHIAGISAVISNIYACRRIVQLPDFAPDEWLRLLYEENVTSTFLVPTMMTRIIQEIDKTKLDPKNLSSLQSVAYGGGRMPIPVIKRALTLFSDVNFTNAYGLTETSSTISLLNPEDHRAAIDPENETARSKLGSVGKPLPTIEIEIRDNDGLILNPLESGEIYVRGPQVSGEYEGSSVLDSGGWFPTRDAGFLDEEGYLFLSGRADDVIIRGGENISPGEIEDLMHQHLAVSDAAAIGIPSEEWGETVALVIVPLEDKTITEDEIRAHIRKHLRSSRVPEKIFFTSELPYNETGKLLRRAIREWFD
jgi:acyl-CoA synthetase (AMP-forming)/AMP-acid ligase II